MLVAACVWCLCKASGHAEPVHHQTCIRPAHTLSVSISVSLLREDLKISIRDPILVKGPAFWVEYLHQIPAIFL